MDFKIEDEIKDELLKWADDVRNNGGSFEQDSLFEEIQKRKFYESIVDIKEKIEVKEEFLDGKEEEEEEIGNGEYVEQISGLNESQIFRDNEANLTSLGGSIKNELLDQKPSIKSELRKLNAEFVFDVLVNNDVIKSENPTTFFRKKSSAPQHVKKFTNLKNVSSFLKKVRGKGSERDFQSDEEKFFKKVVTSKFPLVQMRKLSSKEIKIHIGDADQGEEKSSIVKIPLRRRPQTSGMQDQSIKKKNRKKLNCKCCNFSFKSKDELKKHLKTHKKTFKCAHCSHECKFKSSLKIHLLIHNNIKLFKCCECSYECNLMSDLKRHLANHSNIKLFKCAECSYGCNRKIQLQRHMLKHENIKLFKCLYCTFGSNDRAKLKLHILTHVKIKLFKCSECNYECNRKEHLLPHMLNHANIKLFKCADCSYESNRKADLRRHMVRHMNTKLFKCSECDYGCNDNRYFKRHMFKHIK